jgi:lysophospholipase L1-like esterase
MVATPAQTQSLPPQFNPPKSYYLSLGDSLAYGFQSFKFAEGLPPSAYNTGYTDVFGARLQQIRPGIITVNYGCPGESTGSFVSTNPPSDGCIWTRTGHQLYDSYSGSQLQAALTFLRAHPGQVSPVTLSLSSNDVQPKLLDPCTVNGKFDPACIQDHAPGFIANVSNRISAILGQLRSAAPDAEIILIGNPDTFTYALSFGDPLFQALNLSMAQAAAANRVRFADPFPVFNPQGDLTAEAQALCTLTLLCRDNDSHPSDAGYRALAGVMFDASDYIQLQ